MEYDGNTHKQCSKCGEVKEFGEYYKNRSQCIKCVSSHKKTYREANIDKIIERERAYKKANRDKMKESDKAYYKKNKEKIKAYKEANKEKRKAYIEKYISEKRKTALFLAFINTQRKIQKENEK